MQAEVDGLFSEHSEKMNGNIRSWIGEDYQLQSSAELFDLLETMQSDDYWDDLLADHAPRVSSFVIALS
jgi:hypothetical protein